MITKLKNKKEKRKRNQEDHYTSSTSECPWPLDSLYFHMGFNFPIVILFCNLFGWKHYPSFFVAKSVPGSRMPWFRSIIQTSSKGINYIRLLTFFRNKRLSAFSSRYMLNELRESWKLKMLIWDVPSVKPLLAQHARRSSGCGFAQHSWRSPGPLLSVVASVFGDIKYTRYILNIFDVHFSQKVHQSFSAKKLKLEVSNFKAACNSQINFITVFVSHQVDVCLSVYIVLFVSLCWLFWLCWLFVDCDWTLNQLIVVFCEFVRGFPSAPCRYPINTCISWSTFDFGKWIG